MSISKRVLQRVKSAEVSAKKRDKGLTGFMDEIDQKVEREIQAEDWMRENGIRGRHNGGSGNSGYARGNRLAELQDTETLAKHVKKGK